MSNLLTFKSNQWRTETQGRKTRERNVDSSLTLLSEMERHVRASTSNLVEVEGRRENSRMAEMRLWWRCGQRCKRREKRRRMWWWIKRCELDLGFGYFREVIKTLAMDESVESEVEGLEMRERACKLAWGLLLSLVSKLIRRRCSIGQWAVIRRQRGSFLLTSNSKL